MKKCMEIGNTLVSLIVPIYNAEAYLSDCLESLIAQSYSKLEIILINDGSVDQSGSICALYARRDPRIVVIEQSNAGVSAARNRGAVTARGECIAFVDADDWIEPDYVLKLLTLMIEKQTQVAICGCVIDNNADQVLLSGKEALREMLYQKCFDTAPWGKLFCAEVVRNNPFPEGLYFEDLANVCRMIGNAQYVACITWDGYHYRKTPTGTMNGGIVSRLLDESKAADMMYQYVQSTFPELEEAANCRRFSAYCQELMKLSKWITKNQKKTLWDCIVKTRRAVMRNRQARAKNRIAAGLSYLGEDVMRVFWSAGQ